jgi:hypothetical protein
VKQHQSPVDSRPFQPRHTLEHQVSLEAQYGRIAIDELAAALQHLRACTTVEQGQTRRAARR